MAAAWSTEVRRRLLPRVLEPRVVQWRRDLRTILAGIRGERPPAYLLRDGSRYGEARGVAGLATRTLELAELRRETADAFTLCLRDPSGAELPPVRAGQFFTLLVELDGQQLRRAYSVSSDCRDRSRVELTIKRVADGRVSSWLHQHAAPGMQLRVLGPSGEFGRGLDVAAARELLMIAGGSGITPMMAMLRSYLPAQPELRVTLIYANRSRADVIFADALAQLEAEFAPRLRVVHVLEQPPHEWTGARGRCDADTLAAVLDSRPQLIAEHVEVLLCGPTPMMDGARGLLRERGLDDNGARVHVESFVAPQLRAEAQAQVRGPQPLTVIVEQREIGLVVRPGQTVLEAGLAAGLPLPYSCAMGGCGACKVELERGEVVMREPNCLSERERASGHVLACVSNPISPCRVRVPSRYGALRREET